MGNDREVNPAVETLKKRERVNMKGQQKADSYADGLHGYKYYEHSGMGETELEAVQRRFQAIPKEKWILSSGATDYTKDKITVLAKLRASAPPVFSEYKVTAAQKEAMSTEEKKAHKEHLKEYKEERAAWEVSPAGQEWKAQVERLRDMEKGKLDDLSVSSPTNARPMYKYSPVNGVVVNPELAGKVNLDLDLGAEKKRELAGDFELPKRPEVADTMQTLIDKYTGDQYVSNGLRTELQNASGTIFITGLKKERLFLILHQSLGDGMDEGAIESLYDKLMAPYRSDLDKSDKAAVDAADKVFDEGMLELKQVYYKKLKCLEASYGTLAFQMHPGDFLRQSGLMLRDQFSLLQDVFQMLRDGQKYFDFTTEEDRDLKVLTDYFEKIYEAYNHFMQSEMFRTLNTVSAPALAETFFATAEEAFKSAKERSAGVGGPHMDEKQAEEYNRGLRERAKMGEWSDRVTGRFS